MLGRIDTMVSENEQAMRASMHNVETVTAALAKNSQRLDAVMAGLETLTGSGDKKGDLGEAASSIRNLADNLDKRTDEISAGLVRFSNSGLKEYEGLAVEGRHTLAELHKRSRISTTTPRSSFSGGRSRSAERLQAPVPRWLHARATFQLRTVALAVSFSSFRNSQPIRTSLIFLRELLGFFLAFLRIFWRPRAALCLIEAPSLHQTLQETKIFFQIDDAIVLAKIETRAVEVAAIFRAPKHLLHHLRVVYFLLDRVDLPSFVGIRLPQSQPRRSLGSILLQVSPVRFFLEDQVFFGGQASGFSSSSAALSNVTNANCSGDAEKKYVIAFSGSLSLA